MKSDRNAMESPVSRPERPESLGTCEIAESRAEEFEKCSEREYLPEQQEKGAGAESLGEEYERCAQAAENTTETAATEKPEKLDSQEYENCQQREEKAADNAEPVERTKEDSAQPPEQIREMMSETKGGEEQTEKTEGEENEQPFAEAVPGVSAAEMQSATKAAEEIYKAEQVEAPTEKAVEADAEKKSEATEQLYPDKKSFGILEIQQNELEIQLSSQREELASIRQQAQQRFESMPPFGSPEYKTALQKYNELRLQQEQAEDALQKTEDALVDVNAARSELYDQAYTQKDKILSRAGQLDVRARQQQSLAEEEVYRKKPDAENMELLITDNEAMMGDIAQAEAGLDAMIAAQFAKMQRYATEHKLDPYSSSRDPYFQEMQNEYSDWEHQRKRLEYLRVRAEEDNKQLSERQEQQKEHAGLWQRLEGRFKGKENPGLDAEGTEAAEVDTCPEAQELRALGVETVDLRECREEFRPQIVEGVRDMMDSHPELRQQVREIRCYPMDNDITYAAYGPVEGSQPFGGRLELNSSWYSREDFSQELERRSQTGWLTPNASPKSLISHELGHGLHLDMCARSAGVTYGEVPSRELYQEVVEEYMNDRHADTIVEDACREQGIEFDTDEFADSLSSYGDSSYGEALAEAVAEVRSSPNPRPMAKAIYERLQAYVQQMPVRRKIR